MAERTAASPSGGVVFDEQGNLYGTRSSEVLRLRHSIQTDPVEQRWTESVLHSFNLDGVDGIYPTSPLISDSAGNRTA